MENIYPDGEPSDPGRGWAYILVGLLAMIVVIVLFYYRRSED